MRGRSVRSASAAARGMARGRVTRASATNRRDSGTNGGTYRTTAHHAPIGQIWCQTGRYQAPVPRQTAMGEHRWAHLG
jgi:hypothetical protein